MSELRYLGTKGWTRITSVQPVDALAWVRRLAAVQGGVVDRSQLLACGLSASTIKRLLRKGWLIRLLPGVYALGHAAITDRGKLVAGLLYGGEGSALSHETSAFLWKLVERESGWVHISTTRQRRSIGNVVIHRPKRIDSVSAAGLPLLGAVQTLMDIASRSSDYEMRKALANADFHDLLDPGEVQAAMGRGHPGSAKLRRMIELHMPELATTLSPLEDMLLILCERNGIPLPVPNEQVGPYKPDAVWPDARVIVELDGGPNHSSPSQRRRDAERDMHFRALGFIVLRYTYWQLKRQGAAVAAELITTLAARETARSQHLRPN